MMESVTVSEASTAAASPASSASAAATSAAEKDSQPIRIVFSDLDGTLIHYPKKDDRRNDQQQQQQQQRSSKLLELPPSSTGLRGVISTKTLSLVDEIRHRNGVKVVLVSGMRTSTLLQRLPYLPKADAYCSENGGRIFYPVEADEGAGAESNPNGENGNHNGRDDVFWVQPKKYKYNGSDNEKGGDRRRNRKFGIREDTAWRNRMRAAFGQDGFGSFLLQEIRDDPVSTSLPLCERDGLLWDFARDLVHTHGLVLDTKGYSTCFRVNRKHQASGTTALAGESFSDGIVALLDRQPWKEERAKLATSVNLSCVDFYPSGSGKKNCCLYLASKFFPQDCQEKEDTKIISSEFAEDEGPTSLKTAGETFLSRHAVCLCDDDNDLEMAMACGHAYLPDVSSQSMRETVEGSPDHFTTTFRGSSEEGTPGEGPEATVVEGTDASDLALSLIWEGTRNESQDDSEQTLG